MIAILLDELLYFLRVVIDAVCGERESVGVKPMVIPAVHLHLQIVADSVNQVNLQKRLAADEVPDDTLFPELIFSVQDIVNGLLRHLPGHPLLRVLPHEEAILASQLTVLRNDKGDVLGNT